METLDQLIRVGKTLKIYYGPNNPNNEIRHIRAVVDRQRVIYRTWSKEKSTWIYDIDTMHQLENLLKEGYLSRAD